jgi:hypothetical protein
MKGRIKSKRTALSACERKRIETKGAPGISTIAAASTTIPPYER